MQNRLRKKAPALLAFRWITALILAVVLSVSSFATVMANTVSAIVIDGNKSYTFNMSSRDLKDILGQAESLGLEPLGPLDVAEQVENTTTVNVRRGLSLTVTEAGKLTHILAYRGDTVEKALEQNNILVLDEDEVIPARNTPMTDGLSIEVKRSCLVTVAADGEKQRVTCMGGTVADALKQAGVSLKEKDSVNYSADEPLFNNMIIRVSRSVKLTVTDGGKTTEYEVSAESVETALKKCGLRLSEDDRVNAELKSKPVNGMKLVITRVESEVVTETEALDYGTEYLYSDDMYEDEKEVRTPGVKGEKVVTYKLCYSEGKLLDKEVLSEEITVEPEAQVVVVGTMEREVPNIPPSDYEVDSGSSVEVNGGTISYVKKITGTCTAYCAADTSPVTATGAKAEYGVIAVNPNIIPYGTRLYITSPDGSIVYGYAVACDTGSAAMAGQIIADLCYNSRTECIQFGRREMVLYILG